MLNSAVSSRSTVVPSSVIKASSGDLLMNEKGRLLITELNLDAFMFAFFFFFFWRVLMFG